jgi:hypothetical protein
MIGDDDYEALIARIHASGDAFVDNVDSLRDSMQRLFAILDRYDRLLLGATPSYVDEGLIAEIANARREARLDELAAQWPRGLEPTVDVVARVNAIVASMKKFAQP